MSELDLYWLPAVADWREAVSEARSNPHPWPRLVQLANKRLDFVQTNQLDRVCQQVAEQQGFGLGSQPIRLAVLASSTMTHLLPGLRIAALRRGLHLQTYVAGYGQYQQELLDSTSPLYRFEPNVVLFALDTRHVVRQMEEGVGQTSVDTSLSQLAKLWQRAKHAFGCQVLQQSLLPVFPTLIGSNEHRLGTSHQWRVNLFNHSLRCHADANGVDIVALDTSAAEHGLKPWYDAVLWHRAKQEVHPAAAPMYGELVNRLIGAQMGKSSKCLVLDLDNTLWGGIIGEAGVDGIVLGQGSAAGEAYVEFQRWVLDQARRGVILAVCSKNEEANAVLPFERHSEMALSRSDIAAFVANWDDKATNLRIIAQQLNIDISSLVLVDDSAFERNIVRRELPMVGVPELPDDPALYAHTISDAGYFDALTVTTDDLDRTQWYQQNVQRKVLQNASTDLTGYLAALKMELWVEPFSRTTLKRTVQLINKTNQFNLTTRRYTEEQVASLIDAGDRLNLHFRLTDNLGDNGIISIIMAHVDEDDTRKMIVDVWLMSCRVLGRQVENACMNVLADGARRLGATEIMGEYIPTNRNELVREHYRKMNFAPMHEDMDGRSVWKLRLEDYKPFESFVVIHEN